MLKRHGKSLIQLLDGMLIKKVSLICLYKQQKY